MARFPIANPELRSTGSVNGMLPTHADALGRTQVVGTSSVQAPALKQFVSVTDQPWGAKGDSKRVTDAAITTGTALLSSVSAAFTTADQGKRVDVVGAGTSGHPLSTTISSVSAGVATLAANAATTVSGATVTYGTDNTTAFQNAHSAVSGVGGGTLLVPGNAAYLIGQVVMASNVSVQAYGATIHAQTTTANAGFRSSTTAGNPAVVNWGIFGANFQGDNAPYVTGVQVMVYVDTANSTDIRVEDCTFQNIPDCAINLACSRAWIVNNRLDTITHNTGRNAINCESVSGGRNNTDVTIHGNVLSNVVTQGIHVGSSGGGSLTGVELRITVTSNRETGGAGITAEVGDNGAGWGLGSIVVANNTMNAGAIGLGGGAGAIESENFRWTIQGNVIAAVAIGNGININCDYCTCVGNVIDVATGGQHGIATVRGGNSLTATTDGTTAVLTAVTFPVGGQVQPTIGALMTGTGIPTGSYILSMNVGANTITLNQPTTAANAGITVSFVSACTNVVIVGNSIHMPNTNTVTGNGLQIQQVKYSNVSSNVVLFDPGTASSSIYCLATTSCWNTTFDNNVLENSPRYGIFAQSCHDCSFSQNKVHAPSQNGSGVTAIQATNCWNVAFESNRIWDDTSQTHFSTAIAPNAGSGGLRFVRNRIEGNTNTTPITTPLASYSEIRGNSMAAGNNNPAARSTISLGASPATYTNADPFPQTVLISGGTVSAITFTKNESAPAALATGQIAGMFYLDVGDALTVTYTVVPTTVRKYPQA